MPSYPRRRSYGSGSVYRTAEGRWRGAVVLTDPATGLTKRRTVTGPTAADTRRKLDEIRTAGTPSTSMRTADWLTAWLAIHKGKIAPSTFRGYEAVIRSIAVHVGEVPLGSLSASDVERMTGAIIASGHTKRTAGMARKVLRIALKRAIRDGLVTRNVAAEADAPGLEPFAARALTADEARRLIATTTDDELGPLWAVLIATGLRQGEALGLAWADVDLAAGTLTVRRSLSRGWDGRLALGAPKSERSRRTVALPLVAREALDRQRIAQDAAKAAAGTAWQDRDGLVFTDAVGRMRAARTITPALRAALARAGLPAVRCHDLRHTAATLQLAAGVPLATISRTLGHSTLAITADIYAAVTPDLRREAADAMDRALR